MAPRRGADSTYRLCVQPPVRGRERAAAAAPAGTEGIFFGSLEKIYIDGRSPEHKWEDTAPYYAQYDHFLWKVLGEAARCSSHGGEDYIELHQLVRAVRNKIQTPEDVYDAATWSVIVPLSEQSVASKGAAVDFPDFTRGKWKNSRPLDLGL